MMPRPRPPWTLFIGAGLIVVCQILLFSDVFTRPGPKVMHSDEQIAQVLAQRPNSAYLQLARFVAVNMTPLAWVGYLFLLDGLLHWRGASPVRRRPHHFALLCLASVSIWCLFDSINFYVMGRAWNYIGMPGGDSWLSRLNRYWGYLLAFAAIMPGMLLSGQLYLDLGWFDWARTRGPHSRVLWRWAPWLSLLIGVGMFLHPFVHRDPVANLSLWTSLVFLLDPLNLYLGRPSMFRDWRQGWYGRALAAFAGGLTCGLLWEFWNYWSLAKWTYRLPFLGRLEDWKYFEMPLPGLLGFLPFGLECWVIWQVLRIGLDGLAEPLPDDRTLL